MMPRRFAMRYKGFGLAAAALAGLALALPAEAHTRHAHHARIALASHRIYRSAPVSAGAAVDAGFGPTAPGVSAIMIDATSGAVLDAADADTPRYPASLTKLMTLDLAFQALRDGRMTLDTEIPVSVHASAVEPVKLGLLPGDEISVRDAILGMTTMSANDAATALGEYLGGGSEERCAEMMTLRAHTLGMAQTQFYNASGLPNPGQVSTARDLSLLARDIVVNFPQFQGFFEAQNYQFEGRTIYSNNGMLKSYPGASGMKTGYTILARHNLVTSAVRGGRVLIGVVLHEDSWGQSYAQMTSMLDAGFGGVATPQIVFARNTVAPPAAQAPAQAPVRVASTPPAYVPPAAPAARLVAMNAGQAAQPRGLVPASWTAQVGVFSKMTRARTAAMAAQQIHGGGIPRIAKVQRGGRTLWTAQLAGLSHAAAHRTCSALTAKGSACVVIAPQADHLASRDAFDG